MKKIARIGIPIIILLGISFMLIKTVKKIEQSKKIAKQIEIIPEFEFLEITSEKLYTNHHLKEDKPTLFIYFNTECEHCLYEAEQISKNIEQFNNYQIIMISVEEPEILKTFALKYKLENHSNLFILYDKNLMFEKTYGNCPFPSSFIYNKDKKLVKVFKGEVKIDALLKYLSE